MRFRGWLHFWQPLSLRCPGSLRRWSRIRSPFWAILAAMRGDVLIDIAVLIGFLLTLVRVAGVFVFVPIPGMSSSVGPARVILSLGVTLALFSCWPRVDQAPTAGSFVLWIIMEAALGVGTGLAVAFVMEAFAVGAQIMGLQAGYA